MYSSALRAVEGRLCVARYLKQHQLPDQPVQVVAVGKAATSMMMGALDVLQGSMQKGLVVTKYHHGGEFPLHIDVIEAAHPVSDAQSLYAGEALRSFVQAIPSDTLLVFLLSGGASALVEVLPDGVTLSELAALNEWLLSQPLTIQQMNTTRKAISQIKGGKLLDDVHASNCLQLILSDVPGNDLSVIGSGLLVPDSRGTIDFEAPDWAQRILSSTLVTPNTNHCSVENIILADNLTLLQAVKSEAIAKGFTVRGISSMSGDAEDFAAAVIQQMLDAEPGVYLWGGETHLALPLHPGRGGRCQHIALRASIELAGISNVIVLAGASDGTDGPGDVAGALVDMGTIQRGMDAGLDSQMCLSGADSGSFLEASGDLLDTGPTGTNVNDLVIALKWAD
jgi:hydroxypyruvate reductase